VVASRHATTRGAHPTALGDAHTVLNVGAGAGSYELAELDLGYRIVVTEVVT
jgi:hypothetical protein